MDFQNWTEEDLIREYKENHGRFQKRLSRAADLAMNAIHPGVLQQSQYIQDGAVDLYAPVLSSLAQELRNRGIDPNDI